MDAKGQRERVNFASAALGLCPSCSKGKLFCGLLKVRETCNHCGLDFKAAQAGDGPVVFVILVTGAIMCASFVMVQIKYNLSVALITAIFLPLSVILCLGLMRPFKGLMIAAQIKNRVKDRTKTR